MTTPNRPLTMTAEDEQSIRVMDHSFMRSQLSEALHRTWAEVDALRSLFVEMEDCAAADLDLIRMHMARIHGLEAERAALVQYAARLRSVTAPDGQDEAARIDAACRQWHAGHVISVQRGEQHCHKACPHCGGICSTAISPPRPEAAHD